LSFCANNSDLRVPITRFGKNCRCRRIPQVLGGQLMVTSTRWRASGQRVLADCESTVFKDGDLMEWAAEHVVVEDKNMRRLSTPNAGDRSGN